MKLSKIWVVIDPSPVSEMLDVLFETTVAELPLYVIGTGAAQWRKENTTLYTEEAEARRDAEARMAKEKKPASPYRRSPADRVEPGYTYDRSGRRVRVTIPDRE